MQNCHAASGEPRPHVIRFCSLTQLQAIPAKVIAILGMDEGAFPKVNVSPSLNQMQFDDKSDYCPSSIDLDRYLFLEALHVARDYLLLSYCGYAQRENKELSPSLVVEELFTYLDQCFTIQEKKISEHNIFKHPFDSFDALYFSPGSQLSNFSTNDFHAAQVVSRRDQGAPHRLIPQFVYVDTAPQEILSSKSFLNIKHLSGVAKDPIKFHFNKGLDIYLESAEDRQVKTEEEFTLSPLDRFELKERAVRDSAKTVISQAEQEGKFPLGVFKEVAQQNFIKEIAELHDGLDKHHLSSADIFEIEFSPGCLSSVQVEERRWLLPPVTLSYPGGYQLSIVGKLPAVTRRGLLIFTKDAFAEAWKAWPQFLLLLQSSSALAPVFSTGIDSCEKCQFKTALF